VERAMALQDEVQTLMRLGVTFNQARVYIALARSGVSMAKTIAKNSGVARTEIYRIMPTLEKLGLVERIISAPCRFKAISRQDAVSVLMKSRTNETSKLQEATREMLKVVKNNKTRTSLKEDEPQFILIPEQVAIQRKKKSIENAQRSLDVVTSWRRFQRAFILTYNKETVKALRRGVEIRVIVDKPDEEESVSDTIKHLKKHPAFKVRYILEPPAALMAIIDKEEARVCTCTKTAQTEGPFLWTSNPCLLSILQDYFEVLWMTSIKHDDPAIATMIQWHSGTNAYR
jgi:sugar-specific transcriptional regulator TrmB